MVVSHSFNGNFRRHTATFQAILQKNELQPIQLQGYQKMITEASILLPNRTWLKLIKSPPFHYMF